MISLRKALPEDDPFLMEVYQATHREMFAALKEPLSNQLLTQQFYLREKQYSEAYPDRNIQIIQSDGVAVGCMEWARCTDRIMLLDIALFPFAQKRGIGTYLLRKLMLEGLRISLHVARGCVAEAWYRKLGFEVAEPGDVHLGMVWRPRVDQRVASTRKK